MVVSSGEEGREYEPLKGVGDAKVLPGEPYRGGGGNTSPQGSE